MQFLSVFPGFSVPSIYVGMCVCFFGMWQPGFPPLVYQIIFFVQPDVTITFSLRRLLHTVQMQSFLPSDPKTLKNLQNL